MRGIARIIQQRLENVYPLNEVNALSKIILKDIFGFDLLDLYLDKDINFTDKQQEKLDYILSRLEKHEPVQYVLGEVEFYGLKLNVAPGVLIPRPETEELVNIIVKENKAFTGDVLDIGTGSGCIAISLAAHLNKNSSVTGWDISERALEIAMGNAARLDIKVNFEKRDIFEFNSLIPSYDIIVSNPPYVMESEKKEMEPNVLNWEPELALFVSDENPLIYYQVIAEKGKSMLRDNGLIYYEINALLSQETATMMEKMGYKSVKIIKDISGRDRFIKAVK